MTTDTAAGTRGASDLTRITRWWNGLGGAGLLVLAPPDRNRYTQSDGHDDAAELVSTDPAAAGSSFVYWHWQSHRRAFDRSGTLVGELMLHWGGEHGVVAAGLGAGPEGYRLTDNGPGGAFGLDRVVVRDGDGLVDPSDPVAVRQLLEELTEPVSRRTAEQTYRPLTGAEEAWLHERVAEVTEGDDLDGVSRIVEALELRDAVTPEEAAELGRLWEETDDPRELAGRHWLLRALLRHDDARARTFVEELGELAFGLLAEFPSQRGADVLTAAVAAGQAEAVGPLLRLRYAEIAGAREGAEDATGDGDVVAATLAVARVLEAADAQEGGWDALRTALFSLDTAAAGRAGARVGPALVAAVRYAVDDRLPLALRTSLARRANDRLDVVTGALEDLADDVAVRPGWTTADARADLGRFRGAAPELLRSSGPDLTQYEGGLTDEWDRYRTLTDGDVAWLRQQVADPRTEIQGLGFCLELLYAHGAATAEDVDALKPRWRKVLTKKYETTYTEWRHPLVTLTCLAQDVEHPLAPTLLAWWAKTPPAWKEALAPLTGLGVPDEAKAAVLWERISSRAHDTGHLLTWALLRSRLEGRPPVLVLDDLLRQEPAPVRPHVLARALIGSVDPAQPLWHYSIGNSMGWWSRIVEVVEHPDLSPRTKELALEAAAEHRLITLPEHVHPRPSAAVVDEAQAWLAARVGSA
ncbi:hypothetical protein [Litorihabitans aurantiacus]|uniref:Uncharacterized protein n=1 Tax=Litorihabitans aurantiacus TaxID=1930061 RepID=A0AA37UHX9_9MICO|nr:hypothetical protein [Litorihabitans aurantiacus]GMA31203.1 hypothetical protein GCM10025875_11950 [Litorihabitans aurantiacus]